MNKNLEPLNERERNINWEEVEHKIAIICNKFNNIDSRYRDDLAQELRIHAFYKSDDYYDLTRKAIDFWRTLQVKVMPEIPYLDLELIGGIKSDAYEELEFNSLIDAIRKGIKSPEFTATDEIKDLASDILDIVLLDITGGDAKAKKRDAVTYKPYHNQRISCSYLWEVMGDEIGSVNYKRIRKALKFLESVIQTLAEKGVIVIDEAYRE